MPKRTLRFLFPDFFRNRSFISTAALRLKAKLKSVVDAGIVAMVTQGVTDEARESFMRQLCESGSEEYVRVYQQVFDHWREEK